MANRNNDRGFASISPTRQREIATEEGPVSHASGRARESDAREVSDTDRKDGLASHHRNAAFYHESAAHHHRQAARSFERGDIDETAMHGRQALDHGDQAHEHSHRAGRGFAAMDPDRRRELASEDGRAFHRNQRQDDDYEISVSEQMNRPSKSQRSRMSDELEGGMQRGNRQINRPYDEMNYNRDNDSSSPRGGHVAHSSRLQD
ncbi:MAG: hypothetical protein H7249_11015, partial [Chitinophagaceae bacterium]|nr:hypothetical protein [Oligoflexus sp.]